MSICDGIIKQGLPQGDCSRLPAKGYEKRAIVINRVDVDFANVTISESHSNVLTSLGLKAGKTGFEVFQLGKSPFTGSNAALEANDYYNGVTKNLAIGVVNNDRDIQGGFVDPLLNGDFIAIVERKDKGANNASAFEVLGYHNGLQISALAEDAYGDTFNGGVYTLTETGAPVTRMYLGETYEAGQALFESLLKAA